MAISQDGRFLWLIDSNQSLPANVLSMSVLHIATEHAQDVFRCFFRLLCYNRLKIIGATQLNSLVPRTGDSLRRKR